jgi:hypothetical protein
MRIPAGVEEDQVTSPGRDDRAVPLHRRDSLGCGVIPHDQLAAGLMACEEQQTGQRVGVNVALEPHPGAALHVEHYSVAFVVRGNHVLSAGQTGQREEFGAVRRVQPRQVIAHRVGVHPAPVDERHVWCLAGKGRRGRVLAEISGGGYRADVSLPAGGKAAGNVECGPAKWWNHRAPMSPGY